MRPKSTGLSWKFTDMELENCRSINVAGYIHPIEILQDLFHTCSILMLELMSLLLWYGLVSANGCPTEKISQLVDNFLTPPTTTLIRSYVKDTTDFLNKIQTVGPIPSGC